MYEMKNDIKKLINKIDNIYVNISKCDINTAYTMLNEIMPDINKCLMEFVSKIPELNKLGVDIPTDVIVQQLKNLLEAYKYKDSMLLADTLHYEINDTLTVYLEIIQELEKENIIV